MAIVHIGKLSSELFFCGEKHAFAGFKSTQEGCQASRVGGHWDGMMAIDRDEKEVLLVSSLAVDTRLEKACN
jgi:hypothetical protein